MRRAPSHTRWRTRYTMANLAETERMITNWLLVVDCTLFSYTHHPHHIHAIHAVSLMPNCIPQPPESTMTSVHNPLLALEGH